VIEMLQIAVTIALFILMLGVLVLVHEVGHFVVARRAGIRVHEFGIGFPPRARVLRSDGETLYTLNWLPIGGFVKLEGEDGDSDDPRSFGRAPFLTRQLILLAGVVMNLVLALVLMIAIAWLPQQIVALTIGTVEPGSPAAEAGITPGSKLVSIDGRYYDLFDRGQAMVADLRASAGETVTLGMLDIQGEPYTVEATLRPPEELSSERGALGVGELSVNLLPETFTRTPVEAIQTGVARTVAAFGLIIDGLVQLVTSIVTDPTAPPPVTGPIGIAEQVGVVFWQAGLVPTLYLAALLSANLALVNILPFPPLDGGRMLMITIKSFVGTRLSVKAEQATYAVGFVMLFGLLIWITVFDIARLGQPLQ
jgi:regulator of sigma E protease